MTQNSAVARLNKPAPPKKPIKRLPRPWPASCDTRAIVIVVLHLHCRYMKKTLLSAEEIIQFICRGNIRAMKRDWKSDVVEAFAGRSEAEIYDVVQILLPLLVEEGALHCESCHGEHAYCINVDEIATINEAIKRIHPLSVRTKAQSARLPTLVLRTKQKVN